MSLLELCQWLQDTQIGTGIRESLWVFPIIEGTHVLGLALSVGTVMWFDLRLAGVKMRHQSVSAVFAQFKPWMAFGFSLMFVTGGLLFWSDAARCYESAEWDEAPTPPFPARVAGILFLAIWTGVIIVGRIMAYNL